MSHSAGIIKRITTLYYKKMIHNYIINRDNSIALTRLPLHIATHYWWVWYVIVVIYTFLKITCLNYIQIDSGSTYVTRQLQRFISEFWAIHSKYQSRSYFRSTHQQSYKRLFQIMLCQIHQWLNPCSIHKLSSRQSHNTHWTEFRCRFWSVQSLTQSPKRISWN